MENETKFFTAETYQNAGKKVMDLIIFGQITSYKWRDKDTDSYSLAELLRDSDVDHINVHINCMGGSVSEGLAIFNVLKNHKATVTTICDGFACSAASVVFMAGDKRVMNESSLLMIHNASTYIGGGTAKEFRKAADDLDMINATIVKSYVRYTDLSEDEIKSLMDDETWIDAKTAKDHGFATNIVEEADEGGLTNSAMAILNRDLHAQKAPSGVDMTALGEMIGECVTKAVGDALKSQDAQKPEPDPEEDPGKSGVNPGNIWDVFFS